MRPQPADSAGTAIRDRILVAGLGADISARLQRYLGDVSMSVSEHPEEVLDLLARERWSLLVIDGRLGGSGQEVVAQISHNPETDELPIIYCLDREQEPGLLERLVGELGVRELIFRPIDEKELARRVTAMLGIPFRPDEADRGRGAAVVAEIFEQYKETLFAQVDTLEQAIVALFEDRLDVDLAARAQRDAHKLAGSAGTFGFPRTSEHARELERVFESGLMVDRSVVPRLSDLVIAIRSQLQEPPSVQRAADPTPEPGATPFVLLVDRDQEFADRIGIEASGRDMRVGHATSPSKAREALALDRADLLLLGLGPAELSDEALGLLDELSSQAPPVPVVVLTAADSFMDRVEVARRGGRGFLQKPVAASKVLDLVVQLLARLEAEETKVLTVDDDSAILQTLQALLRPRGLRVTALDDPLRFWEILEEVSPDLLILDVDMPHLSGIELCRVVRNDPRWSGLPVLFLTAHNDPDTIQRVFAAGADDYVTKPLVGPELLTRVTNRLERIRLFKSLADYDGLTGLANRRKFVEAIGQLMFLADRYAQPLGLALIDLDNFKEVNDSHGHAAGDQVLRCLRAHLMRFFRGEDVVARWGGEEFVVGMYGMSRSDGVQRVAELLEGFRIEEFGDSNGESFRVTFSAGVSQYPDDGAELHSLYLAADEALYQAKGGGRDRVLPAGWRPGQDGQKLVDVVLVEDDETLAGLLTHALETRGYSTAWLKDGQEAASALGPPLDLAARVVLLDWDLPSLDGLGVLRRIAENGVLRRTRVIMLTARSTETETLEALDLGAFDHVAKPFSVPVLMRRIRRAMGD